MDLVVGGDADPEQQVAVAADELRRAVQHDVRAVLERSLAQRRGERRVDHDTRAGRSGARRDRRQVGDVQRRVRRRLDPHHVGTVGCGEHGIGRGDVDGAQLQRVALGVLGEQAAYAEVADGRHDDDPRRQRVHGGRRGCHAGREGDCPATLERADGVLQRGPCRRPVGAAVVAAAAHVRCQHDRLVQGFARRARTPGDDGDRRRLPAWWILLGHVSRGRRGTDRWRRGSQACCRRARCARRSPRWRAVHRPARRRSARRRREAARRTPRHVRRGPGT